MKDKNMSETGLSAAQRRFLLEAVDMAAKKVIKKLPLQAVFAPAEAAAVVGRDEQTLARWRKAGIGPKFTANKETGQITYSRQSIVDYLELNPDEYPEFSKDDIVKTIGKMMPDIEEKFKSLLDEQSSAADKTGKPKRKR